MEEVVVEAFACLGAFALFLRVSGFFAGGEPFVGNFVGATGAPVALARVGGTTIVGSAKVRCDGEKSKFWPILGCAVTGTRHVSLRSVRTATRSITCTSRAP